MDGVCLPKQGTWVPSLPWEDSTGPGAAEPLYQLGFPGGSDSKASAVMQETWVRPLGREDPLEKEMATHSSTLAWKIPWMEGPGRLQSTGSQRVGHD